ncbi:hypothetical protein WDW86_20735 [Bdellovibrionota bacterium FG-2]
MKVGDLVKALVDKSQASGFIKLIEGGTALFGCPRGQEVSRDVTSSVLALQDQRAFQLAVLSYAQCRLEQLGLSPTIWKGLVPHLGVGGKIKFTVTKKVKQDLGPQIDSVDEYWTAWNAAKVASAISAAISTPDIRCYKLPPSASYTWLGPATVLAA